MCLHVEPIIIDSRIECRALSLETTPAIEASARRIIVPHVPFAEERSLIAGFLQLLRKRFQLVALLATLGVVDDPMHMSVFAG